MTEHYSIRRKHANAIIKHAAAVAALSNRLLTQLLDLIQRASQLENNEPTKKHDAATLGTHIQHHFFVLETMLKEERLAITVESRHLRTIHKPLPPKIASELDALKLKADLLEKIAYQVEQYRADYLAPASTAFFQKQPQDAHYPDQTRTGQYSRK